MPGAGEFVLRDQLAGPAGAQRPRRRARRRQPSLETLPLSSGFTARPSTAAIAARGDPAFAHRRQARGQIDARVGFGIGARGVVDAHRRLQRIAQHNLAQRHADIRMRPWARRRSYAIRRSVPSSRSAEPAETSWIWHARSWPPSADARAVTAQRSGGSRADDRSRPEPRPFAGMTRIRFKGSGRPPSQPKTIRAPLECVESGPAKARCQSNFLCALFVLPQPAKSANVAPVAILGAPGAHRS